MLKKRAVIQEVVYDIMYSDSVILCLFYHQCIALFMTYIEVPQFRKNANE